MRQEVYVKFAEALGAKKAADRAQYVHAKFAEALQARQLQKQAQAAKMIAPPVSRLARALLKLRIKASPRINTSGWSKYDPRRLFLTTRTWPRSATNFRGGAVLGAGQSGGAYSGAYRDGSPWLGIRSFGELERLAGVGKSTRLSPAKVLAALGLTGGTAAIVSPGGKKTEPQAPVQDAESVAPAAATAAAGTDLWSRISQNPRMRAILERISAAGAAAADKGRDIMSRIKANHDLHVGLAGAGLGLAAGGAGGAALASGRAAGVGGADSSKGKKRDGKSED